MDLVAATHVYQYWRPTFVSSLSLWTGLYFGSSRDIDHTVRYPERSKSITISIRTDTDSPQAIETLRHLVPHISGTRPFHILREPMTSMSPLSSFWVTPNHSWNTSRWTLSMVQCVPSTTFLEDTRHLFVPSIFLRNARLLFPTPRPNLPRLKPTAEHGSTFHEFAVPAFLERPRAAEDSDLDLLCDGTRRSLGPVHLVGVSREIVFDPQYRLPSSPLLGVTVP